MAENYKHLYEQMKKMVDLYQNEIVPGLRKGIIPCEDCIHGSHVDCPEDRVWCEKMCRYMVFEGYCSYGKRREE